MFAEALREKIAGIVELSDSKIDALDSHYRLMVRWNKTLNLTKITDLDEAVCRHYLESLFLAIHLPPGQLKVVDVGSGPGFPGIPVAVLRPDCEVSLIESHQRKAVFLREATRNFANVKVVPRRAEQLDERFDWIVSRAVSYEDLAWSIRSLAPAAALLTGGDVPPSKWAWQWDAPLGVPSGGSRFLRVGRNPAVVSRET